MPIRVNSVTNKPEWKDVGADTWNPFSSGESHLLREWQNYLPVGETFISTPSRPLAIVWESTHGQNNKDMEFYDTNGTLLAYNYATTCDCHVISVSDNGFTIKCSAYKRYANVYAVY